MAELNIVELQAQLAKNESDLQEQSAALQKSMGEEEDAAMRVRTRKNIIQRIEREKQKIHDLLTIAAIVIPDEIRKQRDELWAKEERVQRKDITVAEQEALTQEIKDLAKKLQERCPHPFVVGYPGDPGASWDEHAGAYPGWRTCLVCNHQEQSPSWSVESYATLVEKEGRIIKRVREDDPRIHEPSLEKIREMFVAAAG